MAVQNFDKLNNIQRKDRHIPYDEWFGDIAKLGEQEIAQRIAMARRFEDSILTYLSMMRYSAESGFGGSYGRDYLHSQYRAIAYEQFAEDAYIDELAEGFADDFHRVTKKHLSDDDDLLMLAGTYWFSQDRAMVTAENLRMNLCIHYPISQTRRNYEIVNSPACVFLTGSEAIAPPRIDTLLIRI